MEFEVIIFKNIVGFEKGGSQPRPLFYKAIDETKLQAIKSYEYRPGLARGQTEVPKSLDLFSVFLDRNRKEKKN